MFTITSNSNLIFTMSGSKSEYHKVGVDEDEIAHGERHYHPRYKET
jgi:hypothetical protein